MRYTAEPVPASVDPVTAEYLDRQFNAVGLAFTLEGSVTLPKISVIPSRPAPGSIVYIEDATDPSKNGFYGCIKNGQGVGEWKKLQVQ